MCDSVNHTRWPKEDRLPDWARRDNKVTKGDRVQNLIPWEKEGGFMNGQCSAFRVASDDKTELRLTLLMTDFNLQFAVL